ncbi:MAG: archease [Chloroflexi bacterium]|nr:archease [Chloroflexota bacterium]
MRPVESAGYRERPHTADWALDVWADNPTALLEQAARGMYALMDTRLAAGPRRQKKVDLEAEDLEGLLVAFLSELLYLMEQEGLGFDRIDFRLEGQHLQAELEGAPVVFQTKEIKAVTYHDLHVRQVDDRLETTLVFDV